MKYLFILGNHPELSVAEIYSFFRGNITARLVTRDVLLAETGEFSAEDVIRRLGGTIKIAAVMEESASFELEKTIGWSESMLVGNRRPIFGISVYGSPAVKTPVLAMEIKKSLKSVDVSSRWVTSKEATLSSVVVTQNKLIEEGMELVIAGKGPVYIARTLAVQAFKELSDRDYGRPSRDDQSGMLPPKLAQIMLNLGQVRSESVILDPFCGSGTILCEAALAGVEKIYGSDISPKAIADTKKNIAWYKKEYDLHYSLELIQADALEIGEKLPAASLDAIIFEGYLGPQRGDVDWRRELLELTPLYQDFLKVAHGLLKPGGRLVAALPYVKRADRAFSIELKTDDWQLPPVLPSGISFSGSQGLIYGRQGQRVWRQIIILQK